MIECHRYLMIFVGNTEGVGIYVQGTLKFPEHENMKT